MKEGRSKVHEMARSYDALQQRNSTPTLPGSPSPLLKEGLASPSTPPMDRSSGLTEQSLSPSSTRQPCTPSFRPTRGFASLGEREKYTKARGPNVQKLTGREYEERLDSSSPGQRQFQNRSPIPKPIPFNEKLSGQATPEPCTAGERCDVVKNCKGARGLDPSSDAEEKIGAYYGKADDARVPTSPRYAGPCSWAFKA